MVARRGVRVEGNEDTGIAGYAVRVRLVKSSVGNASNTDGFKSHPTYKIPKWDKESPRRIKAPGVFCPIITGK